MSAEEQLKQAFEKEQLSSEAKNRILMVAKEQSTVKKTPERKSFFKRIGMVPGSVYAGAAGVLACVVLVFCIVTFVLPTLSNSNKDMSFTAESIGDRRDSKKKLSSKITDTSDMNSVKYDHPQSTTEVPPEEKKVYDYALEDDIIVMIQPSMATAKTIDKSSYDQGVVILRELDTNIETQKYLLIGKAIREKDKIKWIEEVSISETAIVVSGYWCSVKEAPDDYETIQFTFDGMEAFSCEFALDEQGNIVLP